MVCMQPSRVVFCHGKTYVADRELGTITEIVFDDMYEVVSSEVIFTQPKMDQTILGLGCDPRDNDADFKLYYSHSQIYAHGGSSAPITFAGYIGSVLFQLRVLTCMLVCVIVHVFV